MLSLLCAPFAYAKCPTLPRSIEFGDIGADVADLHAFLKTQGISGDDGNIFGEKTLDAIRFFQASLTLKETGVVDAPTRKKIAELCKVEAEVVVRDSISVRPVTGVAPLATQVTLTLGDGSDNTFVIDFGDGTVARASACTPEGVCKSTLKAKHIFKEPGRYSVRLFRDYGASDLGKHAVSGRSAVMQVIVMVEDSKPVVVANTCKEWFDGCSTCTRKSIGSPLECSKKTCVGKLLPRACKAHFYVNKPPVVKVTGPTNIRSGIVRQYQVVAVDPERSRVQYAIDWGDTASRGAPTEFYKTGSFSHRYKDGGTYTITAFAKDAAGDVGQGSLRVLVRDARDELVCDASYKPVCGATKVCAEGECKDVLKNYGNTCLMDKAHATKLYDGLCK
jgi:hypothetical protein